MSNDEISCNTECYENVTGNSISKRMKGQRIVSKKRFSLTPLD